MNERNDKYHKSMVEKYGSKEKWQQAMREFGARADKTTPRGFGVMDKEKHREISRNAANIRWEKQRAIEKEIAENEFITKV